MHSLEGYERFENNMDDQKIGQPIHAKPSVINAEDGADINFKQTLPEEDAKRREKRTRAWKFLRYSTATSLLLSVSLIILEAFFDAVVIRDDDSTNFGLCGIATGVWVGLLGVAAGVLGVCSFRTINAKRWIIMAHFVLLIGAMVGDSVLVIITSFCIDALPHIRPAHDWYLEHRGEIPIDQLLYAIGAFLLVMAFLHAILCAISSVTICKLYLITRDDDTVTITYRQNQGGIENGASSITIASGHAPIHAQPNEPATIDTTPVVTAAYENDTIDPNDPILQ